MVRDSKLFLALPIDSRWVRVLPWWWWLLLLTRAKSLPHPLVCKPFWWHSSFLLPICFVWTPTGTFWTIQSVLGLTAIFNHSVTSLPNNSRHGAIKVVLFSVIGAVGVPLRTCGRRWWARSRSTHTVKASFSSIPKLSPGWDPSSWTGY